MKLQNLNQELVDATGTKPIPSNEVNPIHPNIRFRDVIVNSILPIIQGDDEKAKMMKYDIWKKLHPSKDEADLTVDEIALIKKCIGHFQPPLIMGQCFEMIEGK